MPEVINLRLLSHPFNWAFVWVTLALAALAWHCIHDAIYAKPNEIAPD